MGSESMISSAFKDSDPLLRVPCCVCRWGYGDRAASRTPVQRRRSPGRRCATSASRRCQATAQQRAACASLPRRTISRRSAGSRVVPPHQDARRGGCRAARWYRFVAGRIRLRRRTRSARACGADPGTRAAHGDDPRGTLPRRGGQLGRGGRWTARRPDPPRRGPTRAIRRAASRRHVHRSRTRSKRWFISRGLHTVRCPISPAAVS